jgi:ABC-type arginine transport system ATPase subunit
MVGTEGTYSPFSFQGGDGKLTGYDIEVVQAVGAELGKNVQFVQTPFDSIALHRVRGRDRHPLRQHGHHEPRQSRSRSVSTVLQNVIEGPVIVQKRLKAEAIEDARRLLEQVALAEKADQYPHQLSGGQQQRVGIARALALKPKLMLFDEPTSALDPELVGDVLRVIKDLAAEGWTMVIVTHEIRFAQQVADQVLFLDGGVVLESGPPAQVLGAPSEPRTRQFLQRILDPI